MHSPPDFAFQIFKGPITKLGLIQTVNVILIWEDFSNFHHDFSLIRTNKLISLVLQLRAII